MRYKALLLDIDDTIMDFEQAEHNALSALLESLCLPAGAADIYRKFNEDCWKMIETGELSTGELKVLRFAKFAEYYRLDADPGEISQSYIDLLAAQCIPIEGALDAVKAVAREIPVALVTNGIPEVQRGRLARSPFLPYIAECVISEEVGFAKPDPRILEIALNKLGISARDAVMAGDSLSSDIRAANAAGVDACWVNLKGALRPANLNIQYEIDDIRKLAQVALAE